MENPYASPSPSPFSDFSGPAQGPPQGQYPRGLVGHVRVLGILMIVQGVLDLLMGLMLLGFAVAFPFLLALDNNAPNPPPPEMGYIMLAVYGGMGAVGTICGLLNCWAGWQIFRFRQRVLGIVAVASGTITVLTCYCGFTAIGLLIYGLIVLMDESVKHAFRLAQDGYTVDQIEAFFNPWAQQGNWSAGPPGTK